MNWDNFSFVIFGALCIVFGFMVYLDPVFRYTKFGAINFGNNHNVIGGAIIFFGAICVYSAIRKKK